MGDESTAQKGKSESYRKAKNLFEAINADVGTPEDKIEEEGTGKVSAASKGWISDFLEKTPKKAGKDKKGYPKDFFDMLVSRLCFC